MQLIQLRNKKDLTEYAEMFLKENYGVELTHEIKINGRLTRAWGNVTYTHDYSEVLSINIAKRLMEHGHQGAIIDTVKHELIHYALWKLSLPFCDSDDYFQNELKKHGAVAEGEINEVGEYYLYECVKSSCGLTYSSNKLLDNTHICHCNSKIKLTEKFVSDGYERKTLKKY